jgi:hypothetical protein
MKIKFAFPFLILFCLLITGCKPAGNQKIESTTITDITSPESPLATNPPATATWYLEMQTDRLIETMPVPAELVEYAVKVPLQYTETIENVTFTLDFFQEYYPLGSLMKLRITVTNNTGADIEFIGNNSPGYFSDGTQNLSITGITAGQAAYYAKQSVEMETIKTGETVTYEQLYLASPDFFKAGKSISFIYDKLWDLYKIEFPIEVVKLS